MAREFGGSCQREDSFNEHLMPAVTRVAQIVSSIPDKARFKAPTSLTSQYPFYLVSSFLCVHVFWCMHFCFHKFLLRWWTGLCPIVNFLAVWHQDRISNMRYSSHQTFLLLSLFVYSSPDYYSLFFKQITIQLLSLAEERNMNLLFKGAILDKRDMDGTLLFVGEIFSRICRRGSVGNYYNLS